MGSPDVHLGPRVESPRVPALPPVVDSPRFLTPDVSVTSHLSRLALALLLVSVTFAAGLDARGAGHRGGRSGSHAAASRRAGSGSGHTAGRARAPQRERTRRVAGSSRRPGATASSRKSRASGATRTSRGRIARSGREKQAFKQQTGYPGGRKGYVVDHVRPLACGGADVPANMQWQTVEQARAKDRVERKGC